MRIVFFALSFAIAFAAVGCRPTAPKNPEAAPVAQGEPKKEQPNKESPKKDFPAETFKRPPTLTGNIVRRVNEADLIDLF